MKLRALTVGVVVTLLAGLPACASSGERKTPMVRVLAAASLTESFTKFEAVYEDKHPAVDVELSFDSSAILVEQLQQGLEADILATADGTTMSRAQQYDLLAVAPVPFATNTLRLITPPGNPAGVDGLADLAGKTLAVCVPAAPCGVATVQLFERGGLELTAATEEQNVKGVLTKVTLGEVDAGLVYASDALAAGDKVQTITTKNASEVVNAYPIGLLAGTRNRKAAQDWIDLVLSVEGQKILASFGFGPRG